MKTHFRLASAAMILSLSGCVSFQPDLQANAVPVRDAGYVTASFSHNETRSGFEFGIVDTDTGKQYWMPFAGTAPTLDQFAVVTLPPGSYRLATWGIYGTVTKAAVQKNLTHPRLFTVKAGEVTYVGRFMAKEGYYVKGFQEMPTSLSTARQAFVEAFPGFASVPFDCGACER